MTAWVLIRRSLRFHARAHLGVVLGACLGSAALIGALIVGDCVRGSLRDRALDRLRVVTYALNPVERFFRADLAQRMGAGEVHSLVRSGNSWIRIGQFQSGQTVALALAGTAMRQDESARVNRVNVLGIDLDGWGQLLQTGMVSGFHAEAHTNAEQFFAAAGISTAAQQAWQAGDAVFLNPTLAQSLGVAPGDEVILRVRKPSLLVQDAAISPREGNSLAWRLKVAAIFPPELLGDLSLIANQTPVPNAFLPRDLLAKKLELDGRANLLLNSDLLVGRAPTHWEVRRRQLSGWFARHGWTGGGSGHTGPAAATPPLSARVFEPVPTPGALDRLSAELEDSFVPEDAELSVRALQQPPAATGGEPVPPSVELRSSRIFLEPDTIAAATRPRRRLLNAHAGFESDRSADLPGSEFVTNGVEILTYLANLIRVGDRATPYSMITAAASRFVPPDMRDDEILINEWLAQDLNAKAGDRVEVSYYAVDSASRLTERTNSFRVRAVVPLQGIYADRTLMPDFPGVAKAESTHDWDTGFPLVYKIREKDEAYWRHYRGTPKAFITLAAGRAMWASRFGDLTSIRWDVPANQTAQTARGLVYQNLLGNLNPRELGLHFEPVRQEALRAADQSQDFGQLFIGFSIFLVVAALLLMALLFQFSLEQRRAEVGTLLALGLGRRRIRFLLLGEGVALACLGGVLGGAVGIGYAKAMLWALTTVWRDAIGMSVLRFYASPMTLTAGFLAGTIVAVLTIWFTLRKQARQPARELLSAEPPELKISHGRVAKWLAGIAAVSGVGLVAYEIAARQTTNAEAFFEAGSLLLIAGLSGASAWLAALAGTVRTHELTFSSLGVRGCARRRKRSVATIALLACGCFLVVSIGVFRLDATQDAQKRTAGTGGFALVGEATLPIVQDLNSDAGREFFGLDPKDLAPVTVVPLRVRQGEEASCLNLNRAQKPRLLGVNPALLAGRFTFADAAKGFELRQGWNLLKRSAQTPLQPGEVPAIGDANSIEWALGKSVGDTLDYTDEQGRTFKLRLVAALANSILQGSLIIDEAEFVQRFPSAGGYQFFLLDAPPASAPQVSASLARALQDKGLELTPAAKRLDAFNAVQNTYLGTFQILGGLGLLLGSAGLGIVVLRNVLERRGELAVLLALGFRKRALHRLVLAEHGALLALGLGLGIFSAVVAVLPALLSPARQFPFISLSLTLAAVLANGLIWTWLATGFALRGNLLAALRNE